MKKLTERAHQTSDDLTVAKAAYSLHSSFWIKDAHSGMQYQTCSQLSGTIWRLGIIHMEACGSYRIWRCPRNMDFKSSDHWRSMSSNCSCNGTSLQSTSKVKEKILKVVCRATQIGFECHMQPAGWVLLVLNSTRTIVYFQQIFLCKKNSLKFVRKFQDFTLEIISKLWL